MNPRAVKRTIPIKTGINLCMRENRSASIRMLVIGCVLIVLLAGAVAKFGVIDQYARLHAAQAQYDELCSQSQKLAGLLKDYDRVENDYRTYSRDWLEDADTYVQRHLVLDLLEKELLPMGSIHSITNRDAVISIVMTVEELRDFASMKAALEANEIVEAVLLSYAQKEEGSGQTHLRLTILLQPEVAQ